MADKDIQFRFYLNRQGPSGQLGLTGPQGEKGEDGEPGKDGLDGFSPKIEVKENTKDSYKLEITTKDSIIETPNLLGNNKELNDKINQIQTDLTSTQEELNENIVNIDALETKVDGINEVVNQHSTDVENLKSKKQDKLIAGNNITISTDNVISVTGDISTDIPPATKTTIGGIKVGDNLTITEDGTLSATDGGGSVPDDVVTLSGAQEYSRNASKRQVTGNSLSKEILDPMSGQTTEIDALTGFEETTKNTSYIAPDKEYNIVFDSGYESYDYLPGVYNHTIVHTQKNPYKNDFTNITTGTDLVAESIDGKNLKLKIHDGVDDTDNYLLTQSTVTAGDNVTITKNSEGIVISATGGKSITIDTKIDSSSQNPVSNKAIYDALAGKMDTSDKTVLIQDIHYLADNKQDKLIAGDNITITGNTISAAGGGGGDVTQSGNNTFTGNNTFQGNLTYYTNNSKKFSIQNTQSVMATDFSVLNIKGYNGVNVLNTTYTESNTGIIQEIKQTFGNSSNSVYKIKPHSYNCWLSVGKDSLTYQDTSGKVTNLLDASGGSAPDNMVTTDTNQDITGTKTFSNAPVILTNNRPLTIKSDTSNYPTGTLSINPGSTEQFFQINEYSAHDWKLSATYTDSKFLIQNPCNHLGNELLDSSDLQDLVNITASNFNETGKRTISTYPFCSRKFIQLTLGTSDSSYTAPDNGYLVFRHQVKNGGYIRLYMDLGMRMQNNSGADLFCEVWLPLRKNDVGHIQYKNLGSGNYDTLKFFYASGVPGAEE